MMRKNFLKLYECCVDIAQTWLNWLTCFFRFVCLLSMRQDVIFCYLR